MPFDMPRLVKQRPHSRLKRGESLMPFDMLLLLKQREKRRVADALRHATALQAEFKDQTEQMRFVTSIRRNNVAVGEENNVQAEQRRAAVSSRRKANRRQHMTEQQKYLIEFDATKNGSLHEQSFTKEHMKNFHAEMAQFNQHHRTVCQEL